MAQPPEPARRVDAKQATVLYHDAAAAAYDEKWAITFEEPAVRYVRDRADRMLRRPRYDRVLEIGAGTGFFILNLWQAGFVGEAHATDISPRMLDMSRRNAARVGCSLEVRIADAERLPYDDAAFDLVVGHAFLHHIPDPVAALREIHRVLRPGGALFIAGEPTRIGDRLASVPKAAVRTAFRTAARLPLLRRLARDGTPLPPPATEEDRILRALEWDGALHTVSPG
ncbi:MAG TPA: class I SAM-dependent methyltransferase, partial [Actinomycetota bacterium]|nr:class I SAM-dependent methyltransferase [Actinomycetota bacterium]